MKTKKMGTYKKMGLILLAGAAGGGLVGALLGAGMELYGSGIASGAGNVLSALQRVMLPLMIAIGAAGILAGESCIWKMKNIGEEIAGAEDEACDRLEYEYEKAGAFGMKANIITQALCMLVLSTGYSMNTSGRKRAGAVISCWCALYLSCTLRMRGSGRPGM